MTKCARKKYLKPLFGWTAVSLIAIILAIVLRIFLFCSFKVPSESMRPVIQAGDFIVVNKQIPGPRIYPHFPKVRINGKVAVRRFRGIRKIRRNDVLVFNFPYRAGWDKIDMDLSVNYVKRCVALPGDTFYIENGIYKVKNCTDSLGRLFRQQELSGKTAENFQSEVWRCFPNDTAYYDWNIKNFGLLYVPKKGDTLIMDTVNYLLYKKPITYETDKPLELRNGRVLLGDSAINAYTFTMNYYFMAGDYIFDSVDSRYWGLLPEDHIVGKAVMIWKSKGKKGFRWKRFLKAVQ